METTHYRLNHYAEQQKHFNKRKWIVIGIAILMFIISLCLLLLHNTWGIAGFVFPYIISIFIHFKKNPFLERFNNEYHWVLNNGDDESFCVCLVIGMYSVLWPITIPLHYTLKLIRFIFKQFIQSIIFIKDCLNDSAEEGNNK